MLIQKRLRRPRVRRRYTESTFDRAGPQAMPPVARKAPGGGSGYYYSQGGLRMLVISRSAGQHIEINDSVDLIVDCLNVNGVRLSTVAIAHQDLQSPVTNRLLHWI